MSTLFERLDQLAAKASELPWTLGADGYGALITKGECRNALLSEVDVAAYGGQLIGESIARPDREFIAALASAWPQIREALNAAQALHAAHEMWARTANGSDAHLAAIARQEAAHVAAGKTLAPLFSERALAIRPGERDDA